MTWNQKSLGNIPWLAIGLLGIFLVSLALGSVFLVTGAIVNGSLAWLVAAGTSRAGGRFGDWIHRWIPGGVLLYLGLRLVWQDN